MSKSDERCPKCGGEINVVFEPAFQEYPGASYSPAWEFKECLDPKCGWGEEGEVESDFTPRENTRGW